MSEFTSLCKKRAIVKSSITRLNSFLSTEAYMNETMSQLKIRLERAESLWDRFEEIQNSIDIIDADENSSLQREEFETSYIYCIGKLRDIIEGYHSSNSLAQSIPIESSHVNTQGQIKLPQIELPVFSGGYLNWLAFKESFDSLVNSNNSLSNIQKFYYLKSCLKDEASQVIDSITVADNNYETAFQLLIDRYQNKRLIIQKHINELMTNLPVVPKDSSASLRKLLDSTTTNLKALQQLEVPIRHWDLIIIHLISSKIDSNTLQEWERQLKADQLPSLQDMKSFLNQRCQMLDSIQTLTSNKIINKQPINKPFFKNRSANLAIDSPLSSKCPNCKSNHLIYHCRLFLDLDNQTKLNRIKELKLCINCLKGGHYSNNCQAGKCKICHRRHNTLLHLETEKTEATGNNSSSNEPSVSAHCQYISGNSEILLSTVIVKVLDKDNNPFECRALLDVGSQCNFITTSLVKKLSLPLKKINFSISGVSMCSNKISQNTIVTLQSKHFNDFKLSVECLVLNQITENLPINTFNKNSINIPSQIKLADPEFNKSRPIDLLLNAEIFWQILCSKHVKANQNHPHIQLTKFGWVLGGQLGSERASHGMCNVNISNKNLNDQVAKFWELENSVINSQSFLTLEERKCEEKFITSHTRDSTGRYVVHLPFKENREKLGESHEMAIKRFLNLERKFAKDPILKKTYSQFMKEYQLLGHMQETNLPIKEEHFFLPHHPVIKESSLTSKLRVVFDGSAKTTTGISLNDILMKGPIIQPDIFSILINFRIHEIAITADICKMYRQVLVYPEDRRFQLILWRTDPSEKLKTYYLNTVTYGTTPASYLAIKSLQNLAIEHPNIESIILNNFYVDDLLTGAKTSKEALKLKTEITDALKKGGFQLRKWASNDETILEDSSNNDFTINIDKEGDTKTLGLNWNCPSDNLTFKFNKAYHSKKISKRSILSILTQLFDPLGFIGPSLIIPKLIIQQLWSLNINWDEKIPHDLERKWHEFLSQLPEISNLHIPRKVLSVNSESYELHGFCDASEKAYGACVYIRSVNDKNNIVMRLMAAKSRVAPLKTISLPRLELCGAVLLSQLINKVKTNLKFQFSKIFCWTDSTIVLSWISASPSTWKTFTANRVSEIQSLTNRNEWNHISGTDNPADIISRGMLPKDLVESELWWQGPYWLRNSREIIISANYEKSELEKRQVSRVILSTVEKTYLSNTLSKFSSFDKLQRVIAYVLRFVHNCKNPQTKLKNHLEIHELTKAKATLLKLCQHEQFSLDLHQLKTKNQVHNKSQLLTLNPFLDNHGLIRVGGRLRKSSQDYNKNFPILLPKDHIITKLLIIREHQFLLHAGYQTVLASIRQNYWPLCGRSCVKKCLRCCVICFRVNPQILSQQMGDLPNLRIEPARPFIHCGVDYAGPLSMKESHSRSKKFLKVYIALFVCFATKAIHLELVSNCTADAFLATLRRFIARRGKVSHIFSDNGTQFVGANRELQSLLKSKTFQNQLNIECAKDCITWHFIPPRAPHWGGLWEANIKSVKTHIKKIAGTSILTFEELLTLLTQIEACLNSRPLTPLSEDPSDLSVLTPGHFIIGEPLTSVVDPEVTHLKLNRLSRWQHIQYMYQQFWRQWRREYLHQLQHRPKWCHRKANVQNGQLVLIKEDNTPPLCWKMGRITELYPGDDGLIRTVKLNTSSGFCVRDIRKICVLPLEN